MNLPYYGKLGQWGHDVLSVMSAECVYRDSRNRGVSDTVIVSRTSLANSIVAGWIYIMGGLDMQNLGRK